ncbi:uncharacterized protein EI97DRAFT_314786 [Westerdykella ornata]|uniref:Rhodopsin domain-containing protein n=1 Tax=Westerdykella ornata TaxID=318751 RepID=A0A6A6JNM4_WESOR|nr:uncharacterized protein EI97DRAFT_314786 [Westerdykella ornata]KAF2277266.1 hypothetical protein EI97DRAFT_314786 [Westerdykella ornata]
MAVHDSGSISSRGRAQTTVAVALLVAAWALVALRVWTRTYVISNFGWDDATMILAAIFFSVYCSAMLLLEANGGGTHITDISDMNHLIKYTLMGQTTYLVTVMVLKISLGIFFARIVIKPWQLWSIYVSMATNALASMAAFCYVLLRCGPNLDLYIYKQLSGSCMPRTVDRVFAYSQASTTTITNWVFAILPIFVLWNAHMDIRSKLSVGFILSLAGFGSVCSMVRFQYVDGLTQVDDFFWNAANIAIWSTIEPGVGIIAGCLATLRPLLKRFVTTGRSIRSSTSRSIRTASRSLQSPSETSSTQRGPGGGNTTRPPSRKTDWYDRAFELTATDAVVKNAESTECILPKLECDETWSPSAEVAIEEAQERSSIHHSHSARTSQSRTLSYAVYYEPSMSPDLETGDGVKWQAR